MGSILTDSYGVVVVGQLGLGHNKNKDTFWWFVVLMETINRST